MLLINLVTHSTENRKTLMESNSPLDSGNQYNKVPAIRALIDYFYKYEEMARYANFDRLMMPYYNNTDNEYLLTISLKIRLVEQNTDDILDNPIEKCDKSKYKSQEDVEETVSKCKFQLVFQRYMTFQMLL